MSRLRVAFVVQGEGRGHMTQALALARFLRDAGHEVVKVFVGTSPHRSVPDYFVRGVEAPVERFAAPTQVPGAAARGVSVGRTVADVARRFPAFVRGGRRIHAGTAESDVVVNFLDVIGGLSRVFFRSRVPAVAVSHNYAFTHAGLGGPPGKRATRSLVRVYGRATAAGARTVVALSYTPLPGDRDGRVVTAPPLLRPGLDWKCTRDDGYLLAYVLNPGYGALLAAWQRRHPGLTVHCYLDGGADALRTEPAPGFHVHGLDETGFLRHLRGCRAYVGSAGFESVCEARYLGKPVLVVPTEGHYEQILNAWDAVRVGAARTGGYDDLDDFWSAPSAPDGAALDGFRAWVARAPEILVQAVERSAAPQGA